jgi:hypothetical protein
MLAGTVLVALLTLIWSPQRTEAAVHIAEIHEVMAGFGGDPDVQFVEVNMRSFGQSVTDDATLAAFDPSGAFIDGDPGTTGDQPLATMIHNLPFSGDGVRWLIGTSEFAAIAGVTPDFVMPDVVGQNLPAPAGMVCVFGAFSDFTNPTAAIDCVSYGGAFFTGENPAFNDTIGEPDSVAASAGDGQKSLTRSISSTFSGAPPFARTNNSLAAPAFVLRCPTPRNNSGVTGSLGPDADADGLTDCREGEIGTSPAQSDTDGDQCADGEELGTSPSLGGDRDPLASADFYDVPVPALRVNAGGARDNLISLAGDVAAVLGYVPMTSGHPDYVADLGGLPGPDGSEYDRSPSTTIGKPWRSAPPDGVISLAGDVAAALAQVGHSCVAPP